MADVDRAATHRADPIACDTCEDSGVVRMETQIGVPGSGGCITCPGCRPTPSVHVEDDDV